MSGHAEASDGCGGGTRISARPEEISKSVERPSRSKWWLRKWLRDRIDDDDLLEVALQLTSFAEESTDTAVLSFRSAPLRDAFVDGRALRRVSQGYTRVSLIEDKRLALALLRAANLRQEPDLSS
ncbi:hypothetical protein MRX96_020197 [Rhipicephalus microplus]